MSARNVRDRTVHPIGCPEGIPAASQRYVACPWVDFVAATLAIANAPHSVASCPPSSSPPRRRFRTTGVASVDEPVPAGAAGGGGCQLQMTDVVNAYLGQAREFVQVGGPPTLALIDDLLPDAVTVRRLD